MKSWSIRIKTLACTPHVIFWRVICLVTKGVKVAPELFMSDILSVKKLSNVENG